MFDRKQLAAFERGLATAESAREKLEKLEEIARYSPQLAQRVKDLCVRCEELRAICATALELERLDTSSQQRR